MERPRLFLLDAMALIYRAHFVFIKNPRITTTGLNTSAIYGFANTLFDVLEHEAPTHIAVAFDTHAPTFRHERYEAYKANREETPEDILTAIPYVKQLLEALNIPILESDGYEADDLIGTLAYTAAAEGMAVYMMTPDKDYAQLVQDQIYLYRPGRGNKPNEKLDAEGVAAQFGVQPNQIADFLGLKGDSVDNIPGVPKIGEKTAAQLLQQFGSLDYMLEHLDEIPKRSVRESLRENAEQGRKSRELATIHTDAQLDYDPMALEIGNWDYNRLRQLFAELEFRTLARRVLGEEVPAQAAVAAGGAEAVHNPKESSSNAAAAAQAGAGYKTLHDSDYAYHLVDTEAEIRELAQQLSQQSSFCFDTETTSLYALGADLVGIAFSWQAGSGYYVPFPADYPAARARLELLQAPLADPAIEKIGQNLKYDLLVLSRYALTVGGPLFDTMLAHYVVNAESKHAMDALARHYLNYAPIPISELIGKKGKNQKNMRDLAPADIKDYACEDADITFQLKAPIEAAMQANGVRAVFDEIEQPLMRVLVQMERNGVRLDQAFLREYAKELERDLKQVEQQTWQLAGEAFNVNSPKQLGEILFDKLQLASGQKTKSGQYATDETTLLKLVEQGYELPRLVLEYRSIAKLKNTYVEALPELIDPQTGLIHTSFNQNIAVTGRLSSNNPNLQNIPIRTERGRQVRKAFIPRDEAHTLLASDYSQIELRIMADMSGDEHMIEAFRNGADIHRITAAKVFRVEPEAVTSEQRRRAKTVNFGMIYGITPFGLSERLGISRSEAKQIHDNFFQEFPAIRTFMDACIEKARTHGYAETLKGRRHYLPDIDASNANTRGYAERNAINTPIQGTAADMIKRAMIDMQAALREQGFRAKMMLQVHDELLFDVPHKEVEALKPVVARCMEQALPLKRVPIETEIGTGPNWLEAH